MSKPGGFMRDLSRAAQSRRGSANKGKTPWRNGPAVKSQKARQSYARYVEKGAAK